LSEGPTVLFLVPKELFTVLRVMRIAVYYMGILFYLTTIAGHLHVLSARLKYELHLTDGSL